MVAFGVRGIAPSSVVASPLARRHYIAAHRKTILRPSAQAASTTAVVAETGVASVQGTSRRQNEDRFAMDIPLFTGETDFACNIHHGMQGNAAEFGAPYYAVFDGHGGNACADWLSNNFVKYLAKQWQGGAPPEAAVTQAFLAADKKILAPKSGFFGAMGERGIGGSKCGATAAVALLYQNAAGKDTLLAANAGDARIVLARGKKAVQLTEDHVPDSQEERIRIEAQNPNPNMPLVRYVGGTWRVGGLLALSRAFGDAYLKGTGQFEGIQAGGDGYSSGFGVVAEPAISVVELTEEDRWLIISSDGLFANEERGGGGGLSNEQVVGTCDKLAGKSCNEIAETLAEAAVEAGSTDDVTVIVLRLKP